MNEVFLYNFTFDLSYNGQKLRSFGYTSRYPMSFVVNAIGTISCIDLVEDCKKRLKVIKNE